MDNKVNKLVTFFAFPACLRQSGRAPAAKTDFECTYRDRARTRLSQLRIGTNSRLPINLVPRHSYKSKLFLP